MVIMLGQNLATCRHPAFGPRLATLAAMTIQRMDNVGIVVDDLAAAIAFFLEPGLELAGEATVEGPWVGRLRTHGAELIGEVAQYEDSYLLCYVRGPEGIIVALAEQLS
jgi:hypothetical protein